MLNLKIFRTPIRPLRLDAIRAGRFSSSHSLLASPVFQRTMATAMTKRLHGKTILITGASSGIGKSTGLTSSVNSIICQS